MVALGAFASAPSTFGQQAIFHLKNGEQVVYDEADLDHISFEPAPVEPFNILTEEYIPDPVFREYVKKYCARGSSTYTNEQAAQYSQEIALGGSLELQSLEGLEFFINVPSLYMNGCKNLDGNTLPPLPNLVSLKIGSAIMDPTKFDFFGYYPKLTTLAISNIPVPGGSLSLASDKLINFICDGCSLTSLDLTGCPNLVELICSYNNLKTLNIEGLTEIKELFIQENPQLGNVDITPFSSNLVGLNVSNTGIRSFDLSNCPELVILELQENYMTGKSIDFTVCPKLQHLRCENCKLSGINVAGLKYLGELACYGNSLKTLDISGCEQMTILNAFNNKLTSLTMENCPLLQIVSISGNQLSDLDVTPLASTLSILNIGYNKFSEVTGLQSCNRLSSLNASNNKFGHFELSGKPYLTHIDLSLNQLTEISVSDCPQMYDLILTGNELSRLDVTGLNMEVMKTGELNTLGNNEGLQIKVWPEYQLDAETPRYWTLGEDTELVHEFSED